MHYKDFHFYLQPTPLELVLASFDFANVDPSEFIHYTFTAACNIPD
jgi:hypothetical protein